MTTVLLHGFWGQPQDWNAVLNQLPLTASVVAPDLYEASLLAPTIALDKWGTHFWRWVDENLGPEPIQLVGYSMGGRLALTATLAAPKRVSRALFLSANPLLPQTEHLAREKWERDWCESFLGKDWPELETRWQEQPVFISTATLPRRKSAEMREFLALSLKNWSPRLHPFAGAEIRELSQTCDWAFGALDQKYLGVAKTLQELPVQGQITLIPQAGHRLITDGANYINQWIQNRS